MIRKLDIDALFALACGCIMDGCSGSHPALVWEEGMRNGMLHCAEHGWVVLVDVVVVK